MNVRSVGVAQFSFLFLGDAGRKGDDVRFFTDHGPGRGQGGGHPVFQFPGPIGGFDFIGRPGRVVQQIGVNGTDAFGRRGA